MAVDLTAITTTKDLIYSLLDKAFSTTYLFHFSASESPTVAAAITVPLVVMVLALLVLLLWWRLRNKQKLTHLHNLQEHNFRPYTYFLPGEG